VIRLGVTSPPWSPDQAGSGDVSGDGRRPARRGLVRSSRGSDE
jgi:hypothetical protein